MASGWLLREGLDGADGRWVDVGYGRGDGDGRGSGSEVGSVVQAAMLAATEGEKGNGGSGRSDDSGFWGRTTRDSFAAVLVLPTKVISDCGMAMRPRAVAAISRLCKDGCKIFGGEFAAEIGCGLAAGTSRIAALIPIDRNPWVSIVDGDEKGGINDHFEGIGPP
ncbi:hypothetical protein B296_00001409 [Ensete ventricosum]|uniref:Uncharacterized protein n=1 Tax=Ensete ventricosum TaxID=4639 RepID=A0A427AMS0_ENSVE|nr:hypothetical protein B296_00001409 [Ensete ventricosum]